MDVRGTSQPINKIDADALAVAVFKAEKADDGVLKTLDKAVDRAITSIIKSEEFSAKEGETAYFHLTDSGLQARRLLLVGCGDRADYGPRQISQMGGTAARFLPSKAAKTIAIVPRADGDAERVAQMGIGRALMGLFEPDQYRTREQDDRQVDRFDVVVARAFSSAEATWTAAAPRLMDAGYVLYWGGSGLDVSDLTLDGASVRVSTRTSLADSGPLVIMTRQ